MKKAKYKKKKSAFARFERTFNALVAFIGIIVSIATMIYDRKQTIKVLQDPDTFKTEIIYKNGKNE